MDQIESKAQNKIKYLFYFWILMKLTDFVLRVTIASTIETSHLLSNIFGIILIILLFQYLLKKNKFVRKLYIVFFLISVPVTLFLIVSNILHFNIETITGTSWRNGMESYKIVTIPIQATCIFVCFYLLVFDKSVKNYFHLQS